MLGVCGGVAAYKSIQVARNLTLLGARVDVALTASARRFATPLAFEAVTGRRVFTELFSAEGAARHVSLGRETEAACVAPATADFLSRMADGRANDLLTTSLLAAGSTPVVLCPAMNTSMWNHPAVRGRIEELRGRANVEMAGPASGRLAAGEGRGVGRMSEPEEIVDRVGRALGGLDADRTLASRRVLVTAGPTREPIDPVRYLGNRSSGRMGYAIARSAWLRGAEVTLVSGPCELPAPTGVRRLRVETAREMRDAVVDLTTESDLNVFVAAVADLRPGGHWDAKLKRNEIGEGLSLALVPNPDVARAALATRKEGSVSVGFALESERLVDNATGKLADGRFDMVVANSAREADAGFGADTNRVVFLLPDRPAERLPVMDKARVADELLDRVGPLLNATG